MTTFNYQVQRSPDGTTWSDIGGASGSFVATSPFSHDIQYPIVSADVGDYLRCKVTDSSGNVSYSGRVGPATTSPPPPITPPTPPPGGSTYFSLADAQLYNTYLGPGADEFAALGPTGVSRHRVATTQAQHNSYVADLQPGDWIDCQGVHFSGQVNYSKKISHYAKISYDAACVFAPNADQDAVWINGSSFTQFLFDPACDLGTGSGIRGGILVYEADHCVVDGYTIHDIGAGGLDVLPQYKDVMYNFFRPSHNGIYNCGLNWAYDPHPQKGTGIHGTIIEGNKTGVAHHNFFASYSHDWSHSSGDGIECGSDTVGAQPHHNTFLIKVHALHMNAPTQAAANGLLLWGYQNNNVALYIEADDIYGLPVFSADAFQPTWTGMKVYSGQASNYGQNPRFAGLNPWDHRKGGVVYSPGPFSPAP